ncbi:MAG: hypothetical protein RIS53_437 [Bacillota bacterium]
MARIGKKDLGQNGRQKLLSLWIMQMLGLVGFQFLGIPSVYLLIGLTLGLIFLIYHYAKLSDHQKTDLGLMLTSMMIFTIFMGISPLYLESGSWLRNGLLALGFSGVYLSGFFAVKYYHLSYASIFKPILFGLTALVAINLFYTLYRYLPFYRFFFAGQVIYVDGEVYLVSEEVKWLIGLEFVAFKVAYMEFYLTLLSMPLLAHARFLLKPKELFQQWRQHLWWMFPSFVSLLGMIFLPTVIPLVVWLLIALSSWIMGRLPTWWQKKANLIRPIVYSAITFVGFMVVLFFIDAFDVLGLGTLVKQFAPLERILDFPIIEGYQSVLRSMLDHPFGGFAPIIVNGQYRTTTYSMVFDTLHQGGIFAFVGLILIGVFYFNQLLQFSQEKQVENGLKMTIIFVIVAFILYQTFSTQLYPWVRELERGTPRLMFDEPLWLVMFFLMGTLMTDPFVGFLNLDKKMKMEHAQTRSQTSANVSVKKLRKGKALRKGKSQ